MARRVSQQDAVEWVARVARARRGESVFIGVDGCGGAGKSSFAARLAAAVPESVVVHIDDFAGPHIAEWDWVRFRRQLLLPLLTGRPARYQRWDWDRDIGDEWYDVAPGRTVIVEGVSSTRLEVGAPWAVTLWVDTPPALRLERALARDGAAKRSTWLAQWLPSEQAYVAREDPLSRVDLIVSGAAPLRRVPR